MAWLGNNGAVGDTDKGAEIGFVVILRRQPRLQNFGAIAATPISFQNPRKTWALLTKCSVPNATAPAAHAPFRTFPVAATALILVAAERDEDFPQSRSTSSAP